MAYKRQRNRRLTAVLGSAIGLILVFTFVLSLLNLGSTNSNPDEDGNVLLGTPTPLPPTAVVLPTPEDDPQLEGREPYIHSSGYFQTFMPLGADWFANENPPAGDAAIVRVVIQSTSRLSLFHNFIVPGIEYETLDAFSENYLTREYFADAWGDYDNWIEQNRTVGETQVVIDFALTSAGNNYLGRAIHELRDGWLYVSRIVVPANNPVLFERLTEWVTAYFQPYDRMIALPVSWPTHIDPVWGHMVKYPTSWALVAGNTGRPVTLDAVGTDTKGTLRVWAEEDSALDSAEAVEAWLLANEATAEVLDTGIVDLADESGYEAAYSYRDSAGDMHSGLVVLLNDDAGGLHVAMLQVDPPDVNLLVVDNLTAFEREAQQAVREGFMLLP